MVNICSRGKQITVFFLSILILPCSLVLAKPVRVEQARNVANTFLKAENIRTEKKLKTLQKGAIKQVSSKKFAAAMVEEIRNDDGTIVAYVTELEPEGFIITAADNNLRPVLGYSFKGRFPFDDSKQNVLFRLVRWDLTGRLKALRKDTKRARNTIKSNNRKWDSYTSGEETLVEYLSSATQWGPLINSEPNETWHQHDPYSKFCPQDPAHPTDPNKCVVGCAATAMAQIINYWQFPKSIFFDDDDRYTSHHFIAGTLINPFVSINIDGDSSNLNFPSFDELNVALADIHYVGDTNEPAYLSFAAGIKNKMNYALTYSGTNLSAEAYKRGFSYASATYATAPYALGIGGLNWSDYEATVVENIQKGWPVAISMDNKHALIVDGYKSSGEFHLNFGWGGTCDWWYFMPSGTTWNILTQIVYDICPSPAWNQYGADAKNTRRTHYEGPEDHLVKWVRDTHQDDPNTDLSTAIVGSGGKVFAFCRATAALDPGRILIITPHGELYRSIEVPAPAMSVSEPAQTGNPSLPIYIAFDNKVYKILPDGSSELFYEDANPLEDFLYPAKVDRNGNVYVTGWDKMCSININGIIRWSKTVPNTSSMDFSAGFAINDDSGRLYAKYYDSDNDTAHLWALDKDTGAEIWDNPVPAIYSTMAAAGEPTVGPDGTIFARFFKSLRAYNPDGSLEWEYNVNASQEWLEPFISVGPQGNIYVCGSNFTSSPKYAWIRSIRTIDKQLLWEFTKQYPSDSSDYTFGAPVVAYGNDMVYSVFKELSSPGYRKLYALQDMGNTVSQLWEHDGADNILLGSTGAVYLLNRESEQIIALSDGDVGDPDGAGMGFVNNNAPDSPSNPYPASGTYNIDYEGQAALDWSCSDPEDHDLKYDVYLGKGEVLGLYATGLTDVNCALIGLKPGTGYLWKVVATDGQAVKEGPIWAFATKSAKTDLAMFVAHWLEVENLEPNVNQEWVARYGGPSNENDWPSAIVIDTSDNVYVSGYSYDSGYLTIKYDPNGSTIWMNTFGSGNYDYGFGMALDSSDNVYVTGVVQSEDNCATIKYDPNGNELWVARFGDNHTHLRYVVIDSFDNTIVTGEKSSDYVTIKYDSNGNELWAATYNGPNDSWDHASAITIDSLDNIYVTGESTDPITYDTDCVTIKYGPNGNELWVARYNGPVNDRDAGFRIVTDSFDNVYVAGCSTGPGGDYDYATIKYDPNGNELWVARYDGAGNDSDWAWGMGIDSSDNIYVTGESGYYEKDVNEPEYWLSWVSSCITIKYDPNGNELWVVKYNGPPTHSIEMGNTIAIDSHDNAYVVGESGFYADMNEPEYWLSWVSSRVTIKYDSNGNELWVARYDGPPDCNSNAPTGIAIDSCDNVYVTGCSGIGNWMPEALDYTTVKYSQTYNCTTEIIGDLNHDCKVDFRDFAIFANHWLEGL